MKLTHLQITRRETMSMGGVQHEYIEGFIAKEDDWEPVFFVVNIGPSGFINHLSIKDFTHFESLLYQLHRFL
ncbi:hypothetical protein [uncultured Brevibacillus sp.]|uniref:hypothetical protein n=1 Tax=uncultured Brevibacillus sp. TaxID=169970 RepID=UPI0025921CB8|nr:hypothetical protein [uncultured Brevibacillus sp.]